MQQYIITVPETEHANNLLNYIIQTGYFEQVDKINEEEKIDKKKEAQKSLLYNDLKEAFHEVKLMKEGKLKKQTLREFIEKEKVQEQG